MGDAVDLSGSAAFVGCRHNLGVNYCDVCKCQAVVSQDFLVYIYKREENVFKESLVYWFFPP